MINASLFVATYEMPRHLELVCAALEGQSVRDFEVIFCDDGSGPETKMIIDRFRRESGLATKHVWQEHDGFRKCRILNEAVRQSSGEILIFLDGDCIPHKDFLKDHLSQQEEGRYLAGRRVELGPEISASLTPDKIRAGFFNYPNFTLLRAALRKDLEFLNRTVRIPWRWLRKLLKMGRVADMKGCNYSIPRKALEALNGFDEEYEGYGREDTDVEIRLQHLGYKIKSLKGLALQYHIWHPRREFTPGNDHRLQELKASGRVRCVCGLTPKA